MWPNDGVALTSDCLLYQNINTVQARFSDIKFSDYFTKTIFQFTT